MGSSSLPKMLGVKRMPRPLSESRKPESRRKTAVLRGMRLRLIDSPPGFPGQPCAMRERSDPTRRFGRVRGALCGSVGSIRVFGRGAIAADPRIAPVGDFALIFGEVGAPGIRLDRLFGLPDDVELPVRLDLAD